MGVGAHTIRGAEGAGEAVWMGAQRESAFSRSGRPTRAAPDRPEIAPRLPPPHTQLPRRPREHPPRSVGLAPRVHEARGGQQGPGSRSPRDHSPRVVLTEMRAFTKLEADIKGRGARQRLGWAPSLLAAAPAQPSGVALVSQAHNYALHCVYTLDRLSRPIVRHRHRHRHRV